VSYYDPRLNEMFATHFQPHELSKAQQWYKDWQAAGQKVNFCDHLDHPERTGECPGCFDCVYSLRVMAGFLSDYLEGATPGRSEAMIYWDTKYGTAIYFGNLNDSMLESPPKIVPGNSITALLNSWRNRQSCKDENPT
jgi:hypothetical protein